MKDVVKKEIITFSDYQHRNAKTKIQYHFFNDWSFLSRWVLLEPLLEEFKLVIEQKIDFENLELFFDTTFWNFGQVTNWKQREKLHAKQSVPGS